MTLLSAERPGSHCNFLVGRAIGLASEVGHATADSAHLLQAIALDPRCVGRRVLGAQGISAEAAISAATAIERPAGSGQERPTWDDEQLRELLRLAWESAGEHGDATVNSGHMLVAAAEHDSPGSSALAALGLGRDQLSDKLAQTRGCEIELRRRVRRSARIAPLNSLPTSSVRWFGADPGEPGRLGPAAAGRRAKVDSSRSPREGSLPTYAVELRGYGTRSSRSMRCGEMTLVRLGEAEEDGCFWLADEMVDGHARVAFHTAPRPGADCVALSRASADAMWRFLALEGFHGSPIFIPGMVAAACLATPGTTARQELAGGAPAVLDPGPAAHALNGHIWRGLDAVLAIKVDLFPETAEAGGTELAVPELDIAALEEDFRHVARESLAVDDEDDTRKLSPQHRLQEAHDSLLRPIFSGL